MSSYDIIMRTAVRRHNRLTGITLDYTASAICKFESIGIIPVIHLFFVSRGNSVSADSSFIFCDPLAGNMSIHSELKRRSTGWVES